MDFKSRMSGFYQNFERMVLKKKKLISGLTLLTIVALIFWVVGNPAIVGASSTARKLPIYSVLRDNKAASLTFDAAWGNVSLRTDNYYQIFRFLHIT